MLSGEGNENCEKTTAGLLSKKATLHEQHTFFVFLHDYNVKLPKNFLLTRLWRKCRTCFCSLFFSLPLIFTFNAATISHFLTATTKFLCCSSNRNCFLCYLSLTLAPFRSFPRWASPACRLLSLFLYSKYVDMTIDLSKLNTLNNRDTETISAFRFRLYWLFSCLCFTRRKWLRDFPRK